MSTTCRSTLIIPDIHNDFVGAETIIRHLAGRYNKIVFLGDYFDDFGDTPEIAGRVAKWIQWSIEQPTRIHLVGNHDLSYLCPSSFTFCPGFNHEKMRAAAHLLNQIPRDKLFAAYETQGWLLSHAGFCPCFAGNSTTTTVDLAEWANGILRQLFAGGRPWLFKAGAARGGPEPVGGVTWCDWDQEFEPTPGLHQIVGHTPNRNVRIASIEAPGGSITRRQLALADGEGKVISRGESASTNVCLDTHLRHVALLVGGSAVVIPSALPELALSAAIIDDLVSEAGRRMT